MTDTWQGPGWWIASDGKWYPPHLHPSYQAPQRNYEAMTDTSPAPGWWIASDGKWYPPHLHPSYRPPLMRMILHRWKLKRAFKRASRQPVSQVQWSDVPAPSDYWAHRAPGPWTAGDEQAHVITPERWGGAHNL